MKLYAVVVEISEAATGYSYPVVTHTFLGRTQKEAWGYHQSHLSTDAFLRDCENNGKWSSVTCRARLVFTGWVDR